MSGGRWLKNRIPEFLYFVGEDGKAGEDKWIMGPYVKPRRGGNTNRKFKLIEVPMDEPKIRKVRNEEKS
jgi:hypothetical protein